MTLELETGNGDTIASQRVVYIESGSTTEPRTVTRPEHSHITSFSDTVRTALPTRAEGCNVLRTAFPVLAAHMGPREQYVEPVA